MIRKTLKKWLYDENGEYSVGTLKVEISLYMFFFPMISYIIGSENMFNILKGDGHSSFLIHLVYILSIIIVLRIFYVLSKHFDIKVKSEKKEEKEKIDLSKAENV